MELARVLVLNAGSSSLKASVLEGEAVDPIAKASTGLAPRDEAASVRRVLEAIARDGVDVGTVDAAGHRVVHGGTRFRGPATIDDGVLAAIHALREYAPLHNPLAARVIAAAREALPSVPHVASFDTAFHASLEPAAYVYALPYAWYEEWGYRRFGFHGLSVAWATERASSLLGRASAELGLLVAHLGAGCSVTAVWRGASVATSMGMTPLEGIVMATRPGSVDPGVVVAAQRDHGLDAARLEDTLEHRSGMLGISGVSADMRELLAAAPTNARAALAIEIFERSVAAAIAAHATALPRLDAVVFTGGIGEHAPTVRSAIVGRLGALGVPAIDGRAVATDSVLAAGPVAVLRVEAREDVVIAREVRDLVRRPLGAAR